MAIPQLRPSVLSEHTLGLLDELLRFRHFKRYYYHSDFDWGRLDRLLDVVRQVHPLLRGELNAFNSYLDDLLEQ